ncbi:MAG: hypothetical protein QF613_01660 [Candidatus Marinimicrobia bacterium]|nr:hypothetical protein [Candidatus Neomarinimicrobiota bacterium]MDP6592899.1 hypothetical protein [Candidatus Neomarinimicrobiota bacterium]
MTFLILVTVVMMLHGGSLRAESIWIKYGNQVYQGAGDAKSIGLSGSEVASATGPLSILWNPARLFAEHEKSLVYAHQERFSGSVIFDVIAFDLKQDLESKWSLVLIRDAVQDIPNTLDALLYNTGSLDDPSERIIASDVTFFNQVQWAGAVGFATTRWQWNVGGAAKLLMHQLGDHTGYGVGFDVGAYNSFMPNNTVGISLRDASTSWIVWDSGTVERVAPRIVIGDVHVFPVESAEMEVKAMLTADLNLGGRSGSDDFSVGNIGAHLRAGVEIDYKDSFHLRAGRNPVSRYSIGLGFALPFGHLDYAFTPSPLGSILGTSHYLSLNVRLGYLDSLREKSEN